MQVLWLLLNQNYSSCTLIFQENMARVRPIRAAHLMDATMGPDQKVHQPVRETFRTSIRCCFMCSTVWIASSIGWGGAWNSFRDVKYKRCCSHLYHQVRMRSARMQTPLEEDTENTQEWGPCSAGPLDQSTLTIDLPQNVLPHETLFKENTISWPTQPH